jgi:O-antigen ligase
VLRRAALAAATVVLLAGPFVLAFWSGGFFDGPRVVAAIVAWLVVGVVMLAAPRPLPRAAAPRAAILGLALLLAWMAISLAWAPIANAATDDLQRGSLYLAALVAATALLRSRRALRALEPAVLGGIVAMTLFGLSDRLFPALITLERHFSAGSRLEQPLTYWNAMGLVCGIGLVVAARLAGDRSRPDRVRMLAAAAAAPLGLALYLTFSRGALAATAAGLVVLLAAAPTWSQLRGTAVVLEAAALAALIGSRLPAIVSYDATESARQAQSLVMLAVLVLVGLGAGAVQSWACRTERGGSTRLGRFPLPRRSALLATGLVALVAGAFVVAAASERRTSAPPTGATAARLASLQSNRYEYWRVAVRTFAEHPVAGTGIGGFRVEWLRQRRIGESVEDAHSLYLETLAELGLVGLAALALAGGGIALAARRAMRRAPGAAAAPLAAFVAWAFHAGIDWDWEMPSVTLIALLLAGALLALADGAWRELPAPERELDPASAAAVPPGGELAG